MSIVDATILHVCGPTAAANQLTVVSELYVEAFFGPPRNQNSTHLEHMTEAWPSRLSSPGFRLVVAEVEGKPIGCIYGHQLTSETKWWEAAVEPMAKEITQEYSGRTVAIIDLMVRTEWRRNGLAQALHAHFLAGRHEERATLLMDPANTPAMAAYTKWGYQSVGRIQPSSSFPKFEAMMKVLKPEC
jgi:ribosomal protein S18 acetylase RimI-like enzyme